MNSHFSCSILLPFSLLIAAVYTEMICIVSTRLKWRTQDEKHNERVMDFSRWPSFTPPTVLKKAKETQRERLWAGGREERQTVRQPARKKRKAGREKAAGRERRDGKRRWLVASCYSMMISCLAVLSHALTYSINGCWITCPVAISGKLHRRHLSDQRMSVKLIFLLHPKDKNTQCCTGIQLSV